MLHTRAFVLLQGSNLLHMLEPNSSIVSILPCDLYFIILHHLTTVGGVGWGWGELTQYNLMSVMATMENLSQYD